MFKSEPRMGFCEGRQRRRRVRRCYLPVAALMPRRILATKAQGISLNCDLPSSPSCCGSNTGPAIPSRTRPDSSQGENPELSRDLRPQLFEQEKLTQVVLKRKPCQKPALRKPHVSMPCLRLVFVYNARTQQNPVASAQQIIFYERQHSLPNTFSLVSSQYVDQADKCGAATMSWPQKAWVKHSHEFTLQLRDDHFVYAGDLRSKSIRVKFGSLYTPLDIRLAGRSHQYVCHGSPCFTGQSVISLKVPQ